MRPSLRCQQARGPTREKDHANTEAATSQYVSDFLTDLFHVADPGEARGNTITAREILDKVRNGCWVTDGEGYASNDE